MDEEKYKARAERMITRSAGQRITVNRETTNEGDVMRHTRPCAT